MNVIFCMSYLHVTHAMTVAAKSKDGFCFITDKQQIKKMLSMLYIGNDIHLIPQCGCVFHFNLLETLKSIITIVLSKLQLIHFLSQYKNCDVYFFHASFGYLANWLVSKLAKNNSVHYCPEIKLLPPCQPKGMKTFINKYFFMFTYGFKPIVINENNNQYIPDKCFFDKNKIKIVDVKVDEEHVESIAKKTSGNVTESLVLLAGSIVESGLVTLEEYCLKIDELILGIKKLYINCNMVIKLHPRFSVLHASEEKKLHAIPYYYPASFLKYFNNRFIGYASAALIEAANYGAISISLLELLNSTDQTRVKKYVTYLKNNLRPGKVIYFPKTNEELFSLVEKEPVL